MARAPSRGTGFIDFGRYLSANRPQAEAMATRIAGPLEEAGEGILGDLKTAQGKAEEGGTLLEGADKLASRATELGGRVSRLGSVGGLAASLQDTMPRSSSYGLGMNLLDAGLTGAAGGERFQGLRDRYGGLFGRVAGAAKEAQQRTQAPKPMAPPEPETLMPEERRQGRPLYKRDDMEQRQRRQRGVPRYDFL